MKGIQQWLTTVAARILVPRLYAAVALAAATALVAAGLMGQEVLDGLRALLGP